MCRVVIGNLFDIVVLNSQDDFKHKLKEKTKLEWKSEKEIKSVNKIRR